MKPTLQIPLDLPDIKILNVESDSSSNWVIQVESTLRAGKCHRCCREFTCFDAFLETLHHWHDEIAHYFIARHSSGFVEGLNNKLKVIKRRCYGLLDPVRLFQRITLDLDTLKEQLLQTDLDR